MMNPFKALGDINAMRKHALAIQQALEAEEYEITEGNCRIVISGNQHVKLVEVDGIPNDLLRDAINSAIKRSQQAAAAKLAEISKNLQ